MEQAARWLPAVMVIICALSYAIYEGVSRSIKVRFCICKHVEGQHDMTFTNYRSQVTPGRCLKCLCRAFIAD